MKISQQQLIQLIKEELKAVLQEVDPGMLTDVIPKLTPAEVAAILAAGPAGLGGVGGALAAPAAPTAGTAAAALGAGALGYGAGRLALGRHGLDVLPGTSGNDLGPEDLHLALGARPSMTGGTQLGAPKAPGGPKKQIRPGEEGFVHGKVTYRESLDDADDVLEELQETLTRWQKIIKS